MAAKKKVASKALAKKGLAGLPLAVRNKVEAMSTRFHDREKANAGKALTFRNSKFKFQGADLGNALDVIILDYVFINQWFEDAFDPETFIAPVCFAMADEEMDLKPLPQAKNIQGDDEGKCEGCWANAFGSAEKGTGKACQNRRRVAVIPAANIDSDGFLGELDSENVAYITLGGTSLAAWRKYTKRLGKKLGLAPFQVVTSLSFADVDFPQLEFDAGSEIEDTDVLAKIVQITEEISEELHQVPDYSSAEESGEAPARSNKKVAARRATGKKVAARQAAGKKVAAKKTSSKKKAAGSRRSKFG